MASVRRAVPLDVRARAAVVLEREGGGVFAAWRGDPDVAEVRWTSGGRPDVLRAAVERLLGDFVRTGDPAAGLALVWIAETLVVARLDEGAAS